jgi:hypothetical protein
VINGVSCPFCFSTTLTLPIANNIRNATYWICYVIISSPVLKFFPQRWSQWLLRSRHNWEMPRSLFHSPARVFWFILQNISTARRCSSDYKRNAEILLNLRKIAQNLTVVLHAWGIWCHFFPITLPGPFWQDKKNKCELCSNVKIQLPLRLKKISLRKMTKNNCGLLVEWGIRLNNVN